MKVTCSSQEWCGHTFTQLEHKGKYHITSHSYFESEGEQKFSVEEALLEDDVWSKIRLSGAYSRRKSKNDSFVFVYPIDASRTESL